MKSIAKTETVKDYPCPSSKESISTTSTSSRSRSKGTSEKQVSTFRPRRTPTTRQSSTTCRGSKLTTSTPLFRMKIRRSAPRAGEFGTRPRRTLCGRGTRRTRLTRKKQAKRHTSSGRKSTSWPSPRPEKSRIRNRWVGQGRTGKAGAWPGTAGSRRAPEGTEGVAAV